MKVLILAAGYATRLYPYTKNFPKPLLEVHPVREQNSLTVCLSSAFSNGVNKKPIIEFLIEKLENIDCISEIIVVTNNRFFSNFEKWRKGLKIRGKNIRIINDLTNKSGERLGAIGDMNFVFAKAGFNDDYLVIGGDNFFQEPLAEFVALAKSKTKSVTVGVCDIKEKSKASQYGVVKMNSRRRIIDFWEKPAKPESSLAAMCLYYFPRAQVGLIKEYLSNPANNSDAAGTYIKWLVKRQDVRGVLFKNYWVDIGQIHTYEKLTGIAKTKGEKAG